VIRWIIVAAVIYLVYRFFLVKKPKATVEEGGVHQVPQEDVMVQDPWCKTFLPRGQALEMRSGEQVIHFCSPECRDRFLEAQKKGPEKSA
jgi:YHS domain-containing protein